jgi:hypothetical protein
MGRKESKDKHKKSLLELSANARKYRWEFLRRNPWFQEECKRIIDDTKGVLRMPRENLNAFNAEADRVLNDTMDFSLKWDIAYARGDRYPSSKKGYNSLSVSEKALVLNSPTNPSAVTIDSIIKKYTTAGCVPMSAFRGIRTIRGTILDPRNPKGIWIKMSPSIVRLKPGKDASEVAVRLYAKEYSDQFKAILKEAKSQPVR